LATAAPAVPAPAVAVSQLANAECYAREVSCDNSTTSTPTSTPRIDHAPSHASDSSDSKVEPEQESIPPLSRQGRHSKVVTVLYTPFTPPRLLGGGAHSHQRARSARPHKLNCQGTALLRSNIFSQKFAVCTLYTKSTELEEIL
jgi:hypothetical protein